MSSNKSITIHEIEARVNKYLKNEENKYEDGIVLSVFDGIAICSGLKNVMYNEIVIFENGTKGIALNLKTDGVGVILLGPYENISEKSIVKRTKKLASICVSDKLIGRVIDPLGEPLDGLEMPKDVKNYVQVEQIAPGVMQRKSIDTPLLTGCILIDSAIPIGRGQRELIIGDTQTGKTTIAINTIINQKNKNVRCIYVSIGQKNSNVAQIINQLRKNNAIEYTTVINASASDLPAVKYLAPLSGITIAEQWAALGHDVLIIFDDLTKHAAAYRTISLLLKHPPGREAFPGDIFYLHSSLLERAGKFKIGSITALPIVETQGGDITGYISTNIISITDGQIILQKKLFNSGQRPAIDTTISVSRVGSAAQYPCVKETSSQLKTNIAQYYETIEFNFSNANVDKYTRDIIDTGSSILELVKQDVSTIYSLVEETILSFLINTNLLKYIPIDKISLFKNEYLNIIKEKNKLICKNINEKHALSPELKKELFLATKKNIISFIKSLPECDEDVISLIEERNE